RWPRAVHPRALALRPRARPPHRQDRRRGERSQGVAHRACARSRSRISVSSSSLAVSGSASSGDDFRRAIIASYALMMRKSTNATSTKLMIAVRKVPTRIRECPTSKPIASKFGLPKIAAMNASTIPLVNASTTSLKYRPRMNATASWSRLPRMMNLRKSSKNSRTSPPECCGGVMLARSAVLRPVLGVLFGVFADDVGIDCIELHEAACRRRVLGAVEQDPPRRSRPQTPPAQLRGRVSDGEAHRATCDGERLRLIDLQRPARREVVGRDREQQD